MTLQTMHASILVGATPGSGFLDIIVARPIAIHAITGTIIGKGAVSAPVAAYIEVLAGNGARSVGFGSASGTVDYNHVIAMFDCGQNLTVGSRTINLPTAFRIPTQGHLCIFGSILSTVASGAFIDVDFYYL